jgi:hypothetical protein
VDSSRVYSRNSEHGLFKDLSRGTQYMATDDELLGVIVAPHDKQVSLEALGKATSDVSHGKLVIKLETRESQ